MLHRCGICCCSRNISSPAAELIRGLHSQRPCKLVPGCTALVGSGMSSAAGISTGSKVAQDLISRVAAAEDVNLADPAMSRTNGGWRKDVPAPSIRHVADGQAAYRCGHDHTSATTPDLDRPKEPLHPRGPHPAAPSKPARPVDQDPASRHPRNRDHHHRPRRLTAGIRIRASATASLA